MFFYLKHNFISTILLLYIRFFLYSYSDLIIASNKKTYKFVDLKKKKKCEAVLVLN